MPDFIYTAINNAGEKVSGSLFAENREDVFMHIIKTGMRPVIIEAKEQENRKSEAKPAKDINTRFMKSDAEPFIRQLSNLLTAGIPLNRAIEIILKEASQRTAKRQWQDIHEDVVGGSSLADALAKWPRSFPPVYVAMVKAGETGGFLEIVLEQIADFMTRESDLKGRVKSALIYPALLVAIATAVLTFLMLYFIPQFSLVFEELGGALPVLTRMIMAASGWMMKYGLLVVLIAALTVVAIRRVLEEKNARESFDNILVRTPVLGTVILRFGLVRFCRMLGTLLAAGVPLVNALNIAEETIGNPSLSKAVSSATEKVKNGLSLAKGLAINPALFPASVTEMIAVAEESGRLDKELLRLSARYETDLDRLLRMMVAAVEPAVLFFMAVVVGTVVVGMLLPVFTLQELIR